MDHCSYPPLSSQENRRLTKRSLYAKAFRDQSWAVRLSSIRRLPRLHPQPRKDNKDYSQNSLREKVEDRRSDLKLPTYPLVNATRTGSGSRQTDNFQ
jgi:hypothetical protein